MRETKRHPSFPLAFASHLLNLLLRQELELRVLWVPTPHHLTVVHHVDDRLQTQG